MTKRDALKAAACAADVPTFTWRDSWANGSAPRIGVYVDCHIYSDGRRWGMVRAKFDSALRNLTAKQAQRLRVALARRFAVPVSQVRTHGSDLCVFHARR